ncbi:hypothetical protein DSLPV1_107 [Dishui lake phycodnavirus 1]|uniref:hypothetical protein n=1 Tax=Dishui lake phycodnavirus 1 TaxID=2079134 RepID=UPI000CD6C2BF|nr:hypothetical protein C5Y57_gp107 [Dishui lake phycodnavirus 1]AUT19078.1 hypothetical protein DSLPV1_107 [Dishui lake phycodnavirus 1]
MIDVTTPKVAIPSVLFLTLSPGLIVRTTGKTLSFADGRTDRVSVFFHAAVFFLAYTAIARAMGLVLRQTDLVVTTLLFIALQPGMLLTIPRAEAPGQSSIHASVVHAVIYAIVFALLRKQFSSYY